MTTTEPDETTGLRPTDDTSLQGWGRNHLPALAPVIHAIANRQAKADEQARQVTAGVTRVAAAATDGTLPVDRRLAAEADALAKEMQQIDRDAEALTARRRVAAARAEALPALYRTEHETDEDRVNTPRVSRAAERRADVTAAEQDT